MAPGWTVAVTGASGFIGAHIVRACLARGYTVHACVRDATAAKNDFLRAMPAELGKGEILLFSAELLDSGAYDLPFADCDAVFHAAAVLFIDASNDPQRDMVDPSVEGTRNVLRSVDKYPQIKHYIHTSSTAAVANTEVQPPWDESVWSNSRLDDVSPVGPYHYAKTMGERAVWDHVKGKPYTVTCINPTMVFGRCLAKQHCKASPFIFRQALYGNPFMNSPMSLVDVHDVAEAHVEAMLRPEADRKRFIVDNNDDETTAAAVIDAAARMFPQYSWTNSVAHVDTPRKMWNNRLSIRILGLKYKDNAQIIRETADSMITTGWVPTRPATGTASKL